MLWTSVQGTIGVSVIGLAWLVCPVIEAQNRGLFSSIEGAAAAADSHPPVSLDATMLRRRVVTMPWTGCSAPVLPFKAKPHLCAAAVETRGLHQMQP